MLRRMICGTKTAAGAVLAIAVLALCSAEDLVSLLKPPPGEKVAVILFQDLQWPDCASAYPVIKEAAQAHKIPLVIHDFPLPRHTWSFEASVNARYFDTKSQQLGNEFRGYILQNQRQITDTAVLRRLTENFARSRQLDLPATIDPEGKLAGSVGSNFLLGQRIGVEHTPTLFVVSNGTVSPALVGAVDRERLNQLIEQVLKMADKDSSPIPGRKSR